MAEETKPALRFAGFTDDWGKRKFSDFAQRESSFRSSSSDNPSVEYEDVVAEEGRLNKDIRLKESQKTGIVFDRAQVLYGKLRPYLHNWLNPDFQGVAVGDWWVLRPIGIDKNFLFRLIQTRHFDDVANQSSGSKMPRADWNLVSNTAFIVPLSLDEQRRIAKIFEDLDHLITLHQHKLEKLRSVKQFFLQSMFPQKGRSVPAIRFAGFTDAWEQRKLGKVGSVSMCRRIFKEQTSESGDIPFYKIGTFGGEADAFISKELFEEYKAKYPYPKKGDILISASGSIGRTVEFTGENEYFQDSNIVWLNHDEHLDNSFLKCFYSVVKWAGIEGSTIKRLYNDNILNTVITLPSVAEQKKIGTYFENLDHLITLHLRKLEKLRSIKQFCLQNMFV